MKKNTLGQMRTDYTKFTLEESTLPENPIELFTQWFHDAIDAEVAEPNVMHLSTVNSHGRPSSRIMLIKEFDEHGFIWFSNYKSRKGQELDLNPYAALVFFWQSIERQIRIEGRVERLSRQRNIAYFESRPLKSRQGSIASKQSRPVANRQVLEAQLQSVEADFGDKPPCPEHWGGYCLIPDYIEFWQGRSGRFHDRIIYSLNTNGQWEVTRLQP